MSRAGNLFRWRKRRSSQSPLPEQKPGAEDTGLKDLKNLRDLKQVEVLRLEPGDTIVVNLDEDVGRDAAERLSEAVKDRFPGHEVVVCARGVRLQVQREEAAA